MFRNCREAEGQLARSIAHYAGSPHWGLLDIVWVTWGGLISGYATLVTPYGPEASA